MGLNWTLTTDLQTDPKVAFGSMGGQVVENIEEADAYLKAKFGRSQDEEIGWTEINRWQEGPIYLATLPQDENSRWEILLYARDDEL